MRMGYHHDVYMNMYLCIHICIYIYVYICNIHIQVYPPTEYSNHLPNGTVNQTPSFCGFKSPLKWDVKIHYLEMYWNMMPAAFSPEIENTDGKGHMFCLVHHAQSKERHTQTSKTSFQSWSQTPVWMVMPYKNHSRLSSPQDPVGKIFWPLGVGRSSFGPPDWTRLEMAGLVRWWSARWNDG